MTKAKEEKIIEQDVEAVEEPVTAELTSAETVSAEPIVEEHEVKVTRAKKVKAVAKVAPKNIIHIDNFFADRLLEDAGSRRDSICDEVLITADKNYLGTRMSFLIGLASRLVKAGGSVRFPVSYFDNYEGATRIGDFWVVTKK